MKIYTRTGDRGDTGLFGGPRVSKSNRRIAAYGTVDELNAALGLARCEPLAQPLDAVLVRLQHELFQIGAELATPDPAARGTDLIDEESIRWQEQTIDRYDADLPPLGQFILPGGTRVAALLHLARVFCRRAERDIVALASEETIRQELIAYVNRLSDLLFVLARWANHAAGVEDISWRKPTR